MRFRRLLALTGCVVVTAGVLGVGYSPPDARASCVGPSLGVGATTDPGQPSRPPASLGRGETVTIVGVFFHAGCEDTGSSGPGCGAAQPADPQTPLTDVRLTLTQGDRRWELGTADATDRAQRYAISWDVTIPDDIAIGAATLTAVSATLPIVIR